ncbi:diaminopimelate decarboxylase [Qipengyuania sediminis]|uniref:diaminopimelate decarboxylase n=1 Tax=Qipengyuania sediminis TaxID=1532023 RepID=UPI001059C8EB|nr:diaminopimelate decarboxylase [Qipengyuania sediminis]
MEGFSYRDGVLQAEDVPLPRIADAVGTPVYVYSLGRLTAQARAFRAGLAELDDPHLAFAVKANPNLAVLRALGREGYGADVVSGGELARALAAGIAPADIVFSGVGKTRDELVQGLDAGIGQFNLESEEEGFELSALASERGKTAPCALRVNPDVDARTHDKISTGRRDTKFGVPIDRAAATFATLARAPGLRMRGLAVHIGSQLAELGPLEDAYTRLGELMAALRASGETISHADLGGGLGVAYRPGESFPSAEDYGAMVARVARGWNVRLMFEPGRFIAAEAGVLLTRIIRVKQDAESPPFVVVDAAMNDLARPALYGAWHELAAVAPTGERGRAHIVGPVCETGDTFAMNRDCDVLAAGDLAVFLTAGAYGATMASSYNSRALVPEVLVNGGRFTVVAERIEPAAMLAAERVPEWL